MIIDSISHGRIRLHCLDPAKDSISAYLSWMRSPDDLPYIYGTNSKMTLEELINYLRKVNDSSDSVQFAISTINDGQHIGNIKFHDIDRNEGSCFVGFLIGEKSHQGKGYAGEALRLGTQALASQFEVTTVRLGVSLEHAHAIAAYRRMGFKREKDLCNNSIQMKLDLGS